MAQLNKGYSRSKLITIRLTPTEYDFIRRAAKSTRSMADYIRSLALSAVNLDGGKVDKSSKV